ncbi:hypothetical protein HK100_000634 [Physocladia obscura]|uniref:Uncharacterized protein n=1 Tax=Physocladia obscura TaxID=109957 RepID=A0AAD5SY32_9FUNG|nr:hypothetical protein HK100_000634 [Physocladia obscura]
MEVLYSLAAAIGLSGAPKMNSAKASNNRNSANKTSVNACGDFDNAPLTEAQRLALQEELIATDANAKSQPLSKKKKGSLTNIALQAAKQDKQSQSASPVPPPSVASYEGPQLETIDSTDLAVFDLSLAKKKHRKHKKKKKAPSAGVNHTISIFSEPEVEEGDNASVVPFEFHPAETEKLAELVSIPFEEPIVTEEPAPAESQSDALTYESEISNLKSQLTFKSSLLESQASDISTLSASLQALQKFHDDLKSEAFTVSATNRTLASYAQSATAKHDAIVVEFDLFKKKQQEQPMPISPQSPVSKKIPNTNVTDAFAAELTKLHQIIATKNHELSRALELNRVLQDDNAEITARWRQEVDDLHQQHLIGVENVKKAVLEHFDGVAVEFEELKKENEAQIDAYESQVVRISSRVGELEAEISRLATAKADALFQIHRKDEEFDRLKSQHKKDLDAIKTQYERDTNNANSQYGEITDQIKAQYNNEIEEIKSQHTRVKTTHEQRLTELQNKHAEELDVAKTAHSEFLTAATDKFLAEIDALNTQITSLKAAHVSEISYIKETHAKDLNTTRTSEEQEIAKLTCEISALIETKENYLAEIESRKTQITSLTLFHSSEVASIKELHKKELLDSVVEAENLHNNRLLLEISALKQAHATQIEKFIAKREAEVVRSVAATRNAVESNLAEVGKLHTKDVEDIRTTVLAEQFVNETRKITDKQNLIKIHAEFAKKEGTLSIVGAKLLEFEKALAALKVACGNSKKYQDLKSVEYENNLNALHSGLEQKKSALIESESKLNKTVDSIKEFEAAALESVKLYETIEGQSITIRALAASLEYSKLSKEALVAKTVSNPDFAASIVLTPIPNSPVHSKYEVVIKSNQNPSLSPVLPLGVLSKRVSNSSLANSNALFPIASPESTPSPSIISTTSKDFIESYDFAVETSKPNILSVDSPISLMPEFVNKDLPVLSVAFEVPNPLTLRAEVESGLNSIFSLRGDVNETRHNFDQDNIGKHISEAEENSAEILVDVTAVSFFGQKIHHDVIFASREFEQIPSEVISYEVETALKHISVVQGYEIEALYQSVSEVKIAKVTSVESGLAAKALLVLTDTVETQHFESIPLRPASVFGAALEKLSLDAIAYEVSNWSNKAATTLGYKIEAAVLGANLSMDNIPVAAEPLIESTSGVVSETNDSENDTIVGEIVNGDPISYEVESAYKSIVVAKGSEIEAFRLSASNSVLLQPVSEISRPPLLLTKIGEATRGSNWPVYAEKQSVDVESSQHSTAVW